MEVDEQGPSTGQEEQGRILLRARRSAGTAPSPGIHVSEPPPARQNEYRWDFGQSCWWVRKPVEGSSWQFSDWMPCSEDEAPAGKRRKIS